MAIVIFEHSDSAGLGRLGHALRGYGHRLRVVRLYAGDDVPVDLDDVDGVVTGGGPQSVGDERPWLEPQKRFLAEAHEATLPVIGLCLGSQILASSLGGEVAPLESGIELGWLEIRLTDAGREDPLHAGFPWQSHQLNWHREHVTSLPPGARVLADSQRTPVQCWAVGLRTYGFQYHPEILPETVARWGREHPDSLAEAGLGARQLEEQTQEHFPVCHRVTERLFESIALLLMPADQRNRGVVKDLHH